MSNEVDINKIISKVETLRSRGLTDSGDFNKLKFKAYTLLKDGDLSIENDDTDSHKKIIKKLFDWAEDLSMEECESIYFLSGCSLDEARDFIRLKL